MGDPAILEFALDNCRVGKANGSRECAPDDRLRVPTIQNAAADRWWARRKRAFAHPTNPALRYAASLTSLRA